MASVTAAKPDDTTALVGLLEEMDRFYGSTKFEPPDLRARQIMETLFTDPPAAYALVARRDGHLVGVATYSFLWPAVGLTRSLFLKELYVARHVRRSGLGKLLMSTLFEVAVKTGCSRVEWMTDKDNPDAQAFYDGLGFPRYPSKVFFRLQGAEIVLAPR